MISGKKGGLVTELVPTSMTSSACQRKAVLNNA